MGVVLDVCLLSIAVDVVDIVSPLFFVVGVTGEVHVVVDVDGAAGAPIGHIAMQGILLSVLAIATTVGGLAIAGLLALVLTGDGALLLDGLEHLLAGGVVRLLQLGLQVLLVYVKLVVFLAWLVRLLLH